MGSAVCAKNLWTSGEQLPKYEKARVRGKQPDRVLRVYAGRRSVSIALNPPSKVAEIKQETVSGSSDGQSLQPRFERVKRRSDVRSPTRKVREMDRDEKLDAFGRLRTPRAAREMALCILYAATLRDIPPLQVYEERLNQRIGRNFNRDLLESYDHNPADVGDNESQEDEAKAVALMQQQEEEADLEATVLTAPLPLVYSRFALSLTRSIVRASSERWDDQKIMLSQYFPQKWKKDPTFAAVPLCILQMAVAEIETTETSSRVIINEAIDLAKRFCDGTSPRIVHGILSKYMQTREAVKKNSKEATSQPQNCDSHPIQTSSDV